MRYSRTLFVKIFLPTHVARTAATAHLSLIVPPGSRGYRRDRIQSYSAGTTRYRTISRLFGARKMKKGGASGKAADTFIRTERSHRHAAVPIHYACFSRISFASSPPIFCDPKCSAVVTLNTF